MLHENPEIFVPLVISHIPKERLAISPQCGFATSIGGNALTIDEQSAKLAVLCETAEKVWG